jgi:uncharacterized membrane protein
MQTLRPKSHNNGKDHREMTTILAQAGVGTLASYLIIIIILLGIAFVAIRAAGLPVPGWLIQIGIIILVVVVAVFAIKLLLSLV